MEAAKIVVLCIAAAVVYGILHDQVTARVALPQVRAALTGASQDPNFGTSVLTLSLFEFSGLSPIAGAR